MPVCRRSIRISGLRSFGWMTVTLYFFDGARSKLLYIVEKCCIWSPSQKLYVDMSEELGGPFQEYVSYEENKQLWVFRRGFNRMKSDLYQWSGEGEPDCELLKEFFGEYTYDGKESKWEKIVITVRENGADNLSCVKHTGN